MPASLLIILALLRASRGRTIGNLVTVGVLLSLAIHAKLLSLFVVPVVAFSILDLSPLTNGDPGAYRKQAVAWGWIVIGLSIPFVLFEFWKLSVLSPAAFVDNWRAYLWYASNAGMPGPTLSFTGMNQARAQLLMERFGVSLPVMAALLAAGWLLVRQDPRLRQVFLAAVSIVAVYSVWWVFFSLGWPRYFIIGLTVGIFSLALPLLSSRRWPTRLLYGALLVALSLVNWARFPYPFHGVNSSSLMLGDSSRQLLAAGKAAAACQASQRTRVRTQWWATAADLQFVMPGSVNFTTFKDTDSESEGGFCIAVNTRFMHADDKDFAALLSTCGNKKLIGPYVIANCAKTAE